MLEGAAYAGNWPAGLDPAENTNGGANLSQEQSIFGGLFLLEADADGSNAHVVGNQASSGVLSPDAETLTIKLRPGITFSDGTPLNAKAVIWNFTRDTASKASCICAPTWVLRTTQPFTSPDPLTVLVHMAQPNAAILHTFPVSSVNWIVSPSAFTKMGEKAFRIKPVGAGPFTVVSDTLSTELVLKRNPHYFRKNLPYLDKLTFKSIGGDQPAYQALLAGQADAYEGASIPSVIEQAQRSSKLQVTVEPGTAPYIVRFNTMIPPFNNIKAREAIYYATNWQAISKGLFNGKPTVVQSFTTPADLFYHQRTPGYRTYDPAKAKQLVHELGGLSFELDTISVETATEVTTALQTQWQQAGITVTVKTHQLNGLIQRLNTGKWQAHLATAGSWDPAGGLLTPFSSHAPFTGVKDPHLDALMASGVATSDPTKRDQIYQQIAKYISDHALGMFGFAFGSGQLARKGLHVPGLTTKIAGIAVTPITLVIWGQAWQGS